MNRAWFLAAVAVAAACDSKGSRGEACTPNASNDACEPGLVCGAVNLSAKTTCEKQCSEAAADAGVSSCAPSELCLPLQSGAAVAGIAVCAPR